MADQALVKMEEVYKVSTLPDRPNLEAIDRLCVELVEEFGWETA